jgi:hypothetical protein
MSGTKVLAVIIWCAVVVLVVFAVRSAVQGRVQKVVRAERFELVDPKTGARAELTLLPNGNPGLLMRDKSGMARAGLMLKGDGSPVLSLYDKEQDGRASLSLSDEGTPLLRLSDANRKKQFYATLGRDTGGCPWLALTDKQGKFLWKAP